MQQKRDPFTQQTYSLPRCLKFILDDEEEEHVDEKQVQLDVDRSLNAYPQGKDKAEIKLFNAELFMSKGRRLICLYNRP